MTNSNIINFKNFEDYNLYIKIKQKHRPTRFLEDISGFNNIIIYINFIILFK